jgi:hypothetical protein
VSDENNNNNDAAALKKQLDSLKPKKTMKVPAGLLDGANNYDSKLLAIKVIADKELQRTVLLIKNMLKSDLPVQTTTPPEPEPPQKPVPKKTALDKAKFWKK